MYNSSAVCLEARRARTNVGDGTLASDEKALVPVVRKILLLEVERYESRDMERSWAYLGDVAQEDARELDGEYPYKNVPVYVARWGIHGSLPLRTWVSP